MPARPYQLQCMLGWPGDGTDASCLTSYSVCWVGQETGLMPARPYQLQCMLGWPGDGTDAS